MFTGAGSIGRRGPTRFPKKKKKKKKKIETWTLVSAYRAWPVAGAAFGVVLSHAAVTRWDWVHGAEELWLSGDKAIMDEDRRVRHERGSLEESRGQCNCDRYMGRLQQETRCICAGCRCFRTLAGNLSYVGFYNRLSALSFVIHTQRDARDSRDSSPACLRGSRGSTRKASLLNVMPYAYCSIYPNLSLRMSL